MLDLDSDYESDPDNSSINSDTTTDDEIVPKSKKRKKKRISLAATKKKRSNKQKSNAAVIVLDLDNTLIDNKYVAFPRLDNFLRILFDKYTVVLWTAGNETHVNEFIKTTPIANKFKLKISKLINNTKNASFVDKYLKNKNIVPYVLIDDTVEYFRTGDYDINIDAKRYMRLNPKDKSIYMNYQQLLNDTERFINKWWIKQNHSYLKTKAKNSMKTNTKSSIITINSDDEYY